MNEKQIAWTDYGVVWGRDCPDGIVGDGRHGAYRTKRGAWCSCGAHLSPAELERSRPEWAVGRELDCIPDLLPPETSPETPDP